MGERTAVQSRGRVHLVGGGRDEGALAPLIAAFVKDAALHSRSPEAPEIALLLVREPDDEATLERFSRMLGRAGASVVPRVVFEGETFDVDAVGACDGVFVAGGLTPAYVHAVSEIVDEVRARVGGGIPYLGFSAGAAIAAGRALIGGYRVGDIEVCDADFAEDLDDVAVVDGLGLVPFTVEVHAAQWGTLSRVIAAAQAGLVGAAVAIDEHTAVVVDAEARGDDVAVTGRGAAWQVTCLDPQGEGVVVGRHAAQS